MNQTTLELLVEDLQRDSAASLDPRRLAQVKRRGARHRRTRATLTVVVATIAVGGSAAWLAPGLDQGDRERDTVAVDVATRPTELSALQKRVLREVPGAEQISAWQVVIPEPAGAVDEMEGILSEDFEVQGEAFPTGVPSYEGVTMYERGAFPAWLYDAVLAIEKEADTGDGRPVGSTDMGIAVVDGTLELGCVSFQGADCEPAVVRNEGGRRHYEWGFGTEDFLEPGTGMEVFAGNAAPEDAPSLAVAGLPDDSVTRVEFINTVGEVVEGTVDHTMAPGSSILWAAVPGALARVVAYDAEGDVVEDHELRPCNGGVDCEVR